MLKNAIKLTAPATLFILAAILIGMPVARARFLANTAESWIALAQAAGFIFGLLTIIAIYFTWSAQGAQSALRTTSEGAKCRPEPEASSTSYTPIGGRTFGQLIVMAFAFVAATGALMLLTPETLLAAMIGLAIAVAVTFKFDGFNPIVLAAAALLMAVLVKGEFYPSARECERLVSHFDWLGEQQDEAIAYWQQCTYATGSEYESCADSKPSRSPEELQSERRRVWWRLADRCGSTEGRDLPV